MIGQKNPVFLILILMPVANLIQWATLKAFKDGANFSVILDKANSVDCSYSVSKECPIVEDSVVIANRNVTYRFCKEKFQEPNQKVIIGVLSTGAKGFPQREAIRHTWGRHANNIYFLVAGEEAYPELEDEMKKNNDIIWFDSPETYRDIFFKSLGFFAIVSIHGPKDYEFAFKTDDDVYIDMDMFSTTINEAQNRDYIGFCRRRGRIIRDPKHRWYVPEEAYPNATIYRPYADGGGYFLSRNVLSNHSSCILQNIENTPFIPIEDAAMGEVSRTCSGGTSNTVCSHLSHATRKLKDTNELKRIKAIKRDKKKNTVIALKELKSDWLFYLAHVQYCLRHRGDVSCLDYNLPYDAVGSITV